MLIHVSNRQTDRQMEMKEEIDGLVIQGWIQLYIYIYTQTKITIDKGWLNVWMDRQTNGQN